MDLWIPLTVGAAFIQNLRSVAQRRLLGRVTVSAATFSRFFYGFPLAVLLLAGLCIAADRWPPEPTAAFVAYATLGAVTQVIGNALFIKLIRVSNFAVMTTYAKMETVLSPVLSFILLNDRLSPLGILGIVVAFLGVMMLAAARVEGSVKALLLASLQRPASLGIGVGALYALTSTCYRAATLELGDIGFLLQASTLLTWVTGLQVLIMGAYLAWFTPPVFREVVREWRPLIWIGVTGMTASICWMSAFALQQTGYVLAVGQIELVFAYLSSHLLFKERTTRAEIAGILVTVAGILTVVLGR